MRRLSKNPHSLIGAHVSMAGGLDKAIERAAAIGANCAQIFSGSPRSWARKLPGRKTLDKMYAKQEELGVKSIFTHALYLVNLASPKPDLLTKSTNSLIHDLKFDNLVKGSGLVVHLGSHLGRGWEAIKEDLLAKLQHVLSKTPPDSTLLIEDSAGQKGKIASELEEIRWLLDRLDPKRVGWCVDTCHAFAAGYPLVASSRFTEQTTKPDLVSAIKQLDLATSLKCIHVNDSKVKFAAGDDKHDNIGEGLIPQEDLQAFLRTPIFSEIPLITEAPGFDGKGPDEKNMKRLKKLAEE